MPEGDTIFRAARTLHRALAGQSVTRFETVLPHLSRVDQDAPLAGRLVEGVEARGKWMLVRFSGDLVLLTHMRMNGSWHIYRHGEAWRRGRHRASIDRDFIICCRRVRYSGCRVPRFGIAVAASQPEPAGT